MFLILCVIIGLAGVGLSIWGIKKPIEIKYTYSWDAWVEPILFSFIGVLLLIVSEIAFSNIVLGKITASSLCDKIIRIFIENGILIPFFSAGLSKFFERMVERLNLDYLEYYSNLISKICFSVLVSACCIAFIYITYRKINQFEFFINRVVMWGLTVFGTWIGFGFGCNGRIEKENKKRKNIINMPDKKEILKFWIPIIWPLALCIILLVILCVVDLKKIVQFEKYLYALTFIFCSSCIGSLLILKRIVNPDSKKSDSDFDKLIKKYKNGKTIKKNYGRNRYCIENGILKIEKISICYPGHENDTKFRELFDEIDDYEVDVKNYNGVSEFLRKRDREQKDYIKRGFDDCIDELKKKQLISF